ncbi:MAG: metalloregulator ArsR/SmtB family transcription factor [Oscillospiraceae bacterium]|nr:metalloregulator ArsR/SmtB family transcription factor [Oscillospiraceae bacterium]
MVDKYTQNAVLFKALADKNRLQIVDMLSCGDKCACNLLENFDITQPTLSHHMKILCDCGLVSARKDGKMTMYSLNNQTVEDIKGCLCTKGGNSEECICDEDCDCKELHV